MPYYRNVPFKGEVYFQKLMLWDLITLNYPLTTNYPIVTSSTLLQCIFYVWRGIWNIIEKVPYNMEHISGHFQPKLMTGFWNIIKKVHFWTILSPFCPIRAKQDFFRKIWLCHFSVFIIP